MKAINIFNNSKDSYDHWIIAIVIGLVLFGSVMVYSTSAVLASSNYHNQFYFLWRQVAAAVIGLGIMAAILWFGYLHLNNKIIVYGILGICTILLISVLFLPAVRNTHRFIRISSFSFQPSELAKISLIIFLAYLLSNRTKEERHSLWMTFIPCTVVTTFLMALIIKGQDLGTVLVMALITGAMLFAAEVPLRYPLIGIVASTPIIIYELVKAPYRIARLRAFLDPWKHARNEGFQVVQSLIAIGSGGISGCGLAEGKQKLFYLPEAHTDFIFAVIGEELGLLGAVTIILLFGLLAWRGFLVASKANDIFGSLLAIGTTVMLVSQAFFNISVVLGIVPNKGIPLPFISYGGSSLIISLATVGLLLSVSQNKRTKG